MKILLTGFEPFGKIRVNPSELAVRTIAGRNRIPGCEIFASILPTEFRRAGREVRRLIRTIKPDVVIATGVAAGRDAICLERVALNIDESLEPDNSGRAATGTPIVRGGPLAYESTLPLNKLRLAIAKRRIPVRISCHAGTYVCNHVFYAARHETESQKPGAACGFIHVPNLPGKSKRVRGKIAGGMPLKKTIDAIQCCIQAVAGNSKRSRAR